MVGAKNTVRRWENGVECTWEHGVGPLGSMELSAGIWNWMSIIRSTAVLVEIEWCGLVKIFYHI